MHTPMFSVVIPALNEEKYISHLLSSLTEQSYTDFEVILVDGRSKDKTVSVAKTFHSKLKNFSIVVAPHASLPYQRNVGAQNAKGEWLIFVDADTVLLPYTIERIAAYIASHDVSFLTTWCTPDSERINDSVLALMGNIFYEGSLRFKRPVSPGPFTVVRETLFHEIDGYDEEHPFLEDQDFSQRMTKHGVDLHIIRETLYVWSLRRYRKKGMMSVMGEYAKAVIPIAFFKKTPKNMTGYPMGGHIFSENAKKQKLTKLNLRKLEKTIQKFMKELFE